MAQAPSANEVQSLITAIAADLREPTLIWQILAVLVALALARGLNQWLRPRLEKVVGNWRVGAAGIERVLFPVLALLLVLIAKGALIAWNPVRLLQLTAALLVAMAIVRFAVLLLQTVFADTPLLRAWARAVAWTVWLGLALHLTGVLPAITGFLDELTLPLGKHQVSLLLLLRGAISVVVTLLVAMWIARLIEHRLMRAQSLDMHVRIVFTKLAKAALILAAVLFALSAVGLDLTLLSVFGGALGVGLGFGLQKIASNYVSGFIMLAERSLSIGNSVVIDGREGVVTKLSGRFIVVRNADGTDALIPNETAITNTVINKSYSDNRARVSLPLQIAYRHDLEDTIALIESVARAQPGVLAEPSPVALVTSFAENGIDIELWAWIDNPEASRALLRSDLYRALWKAFGEHGIEVPYPQREVRLITPPEAASKA